MLKDIWLTNTTLYMGKEAGKNVLDKVISAEKSIFICSPFLSPKYIAILRQKKDEGINVKLITSTSVLKQKRIFNELFTKKEYTCGHALNEKKSCFITAFNCFLSFFLIFTYSSSPLWIIPLFWSVIKSSQYISITTKKNKFIPRIQFTTVEDSNAKSAPGCYTLHAKFIIIDNKEAFWGSHNYTEKGFFYNYETSMNTTNAYVVNQLIDEFHSLYHIHSSPKNNSN
jgi:phosphatidylserine/phosphatidylglycerophosphate/cardiolipin synthase-like enzyme